MRVQVAGFTSAAGAADAGQDPGDDLVAEGEQGVAAWDVQPGPGAVADPVKQVLHLGAGAKQQVAAVFGLVDGAAVGKPAAGLLGQVQAKAQARGIDPPVADLAQAPYSRKLRQGICDPGQAPRIRDVSKAVALLGKPDPAARAAAATYSWPLRMTCAGNGGCPDILTVTWPQAGP